MNNDLFLKRLKEVAELEEPETYVDTITEIVTIDDEEVSVSKEVLVESQHPPKIKKIIPIVKACPDCNNIVENRCLTRKYYQSYGGHWRQHCSACDKYWDPRTNEYTLSARDSNVYWQNILRRKNPFPIHETDDSIVVFYDRKIDVAK